MKHDETRASSISTSIVKERCDELGLTYISQHIKNQKTFVTYKCPKHIDKGEISSAWTHIRTAKKGCPYCSGKYKTTDDFKKEIKNILPDVEVVGEYKTARSKILVRCYVCGHNWNPEARSLQYGQGCPVCAKRKRAELRRKSLDEFIEDMKVVSPDTEIIGEYNGSHELIKCRCKRHKQEWESYSCNLLNGSAGCPMCAKERLGNTPSKGERRIAKWLDENGFEYVSEHKLDGCVYKRPLRFDFYLPKFNTVIEFDGQQHFEQVKRFDQTPEKFSDTQSRDIAKNKYCNEHGIRMLRIPFTHYDRIYDILNTEIKDKIHLH